MGLGARLRRIGHHLLRDPAAGEPTTSTRHTPADSHMLAGSCLDDLADWLAETVVDTLPTRLGAASTFDARAQVTSFLAAYSERPVRDNDGGSGFHSLFWIHMVAAMLAPRKIVESGVWKGQSTWTLRRACPQSDIFSFDVDLAGLEHTDPGASYTEADWTAVEMVGDDRDLAFFDCHVNHGRRLHEAHSRGFRWVLVDDDAPAGRLYGFGRPPVPTVAMLTDNRLRDGDVLAWKWRGADREYTFREADAHGARELIEEAWHLPDVATPTMYGGFSFMTLVRLRG